MLGLESIAQYLLFSDRFFELHTFSCAHQRCPYGVYFTSSDVVGSRVRGSPLETICRRTGHSLRHQYRAFHINSIGHFWYSSWWMLLLALFLVKVNWIRKIMASISYFIFRNQLVISVKILACFVRTAYVSTTHTSWIVLRLLYKRIYSVLK